MPSLYIDDDGPVFSLSDLGGMASQVVLQAGPMLQQRSLAVSDQQTEIQGLEAGHILGQGEDEHGVVSCRDRRLNELRHQSAQGVRALVGGCNGQHFEDISGAGAAGDHLTILE